MKYKILKAIDIAGLNFLDPVVRLAYREEPRVQLKKIGQFIVVPAFALLLFVLVWFSVSAGVKTKSGTLPNPTQTNDARVSIGDFGRMEDAKADDYLAEGGTRDERLADVEKALADLPAEQEEAAAELTAAEEKWAKQKGTATRQPVEALAAFEQSSEAAEAEREAEMEALAAQITTGESTIHAKLLELLRAHEAQKELDKETERNLKAAIDDRSFEPAYLARAKARVSALADREQNLKKREQMLSTSNREAKAEKLAERADLAQQNFYAASGAESLALAKKVVAAEKRLATVQESEYAKPKSLWYQTKRSLLCVFFGFFVATAIAVPIGILCGLSKTFMAAMTPFIALFKPVSPIVWLPIVLIIVSAQIPDPDTHWLTQWLWDLPWLGYYKINPAFIASGIVVALCSLWPTLVNTALGVASVDKDHNNVAKVLKLGFWSRLFKIVIPSALPLIFAGLRISLGVGWMVLIAAELLASSEGIGKFVWDQFQNGSSDSLAKMVYVVFVVGFFGLLLDRIMIVLQKLVTFDDGTTTA